MHCWSLGIRDRPHPPSFSLGFIQLVTSTVFMAAWSTGLAQVDLGWWPTLLRPGLGVWKRLCICSVWSKKGETRHLVAASTRRIRTCRYINIPPFYRRNAFPFVTVHQGYLCVSPKGWRQSWACVPTFIPWALDQSLQEDLGEIRDPEYLLNAVLVLHHTHLPSRRWMGTAVLWIELHQVLLGKWILIPYWLRSIFSCTYCPLVLLLWRSVYSNSMLLKKFVFLFCMLWGYILMYILIYIWDLSGESPVIVNMTRTVCTTLI